MNNANKGNGWIVNNWQAGIRVGPMDLKLMDGVLDVHTWLHSPGIIVFDTKINPQALRDLLTKACLTSLMAMAGKQLAEQNNSPTQKPQPAPIPALTSRKVLETLDVELIKLEAHVHSPLLDLLRSLGLMR